MFTTIVAHDNADGIGKNSSIPWQLKEDLVHFRQLTIGQVVIMGRKTHQSIGRPLMNRINIVISATKQNIPGCIVFNDLYECVRYCFENSNELFKGKKFFVIGGSQIYKWFLENNLVYEEYITEVDCNANCDVFYKVPNQTQYEKCKEIIIKEINPSMRQNNIMQNTESYRCRIEPDIIDLTQDDEDNEDFNGKDFNGKDFNGKDFNGNLNFANLTLDVKVPHVQIEPRAIIVHRQYSNVEEQNFLLLLRKIILQGEKRFDRTHVGTLSLFGEQLTFDLTNGKFPLLTTRKMYIKGIFEELMLFIRGETNTKILEEKNVNVWKGNTSREFLDGCGLQHLPIGDMGHSYGFSMRHFGADYIDCTKDYTGQGFDQLFWVISEIKKNPHSRRLIISLWEPNHMQNAALPPCLYNYQFYVEGQYLSCKMTQRSSDVAVAGGWNIITGTLLTIMIAHVTELNPKKLIWSLGDAQCGKGQGANYPCA